MGQKRRKELPSKLPKEHPNHAEGEYLSIKFWKPDVPGNSTLPFLVCTQYITTGHQRLDFQFPRNTATACPRLDTGIIHRVEVDALRPSGLGKGTFPQN